MVTEDTFFHQALIIIMFFFRDKISLWLLGFPVSCTPSKLFSYMKKVEKLNQKLNCKVLIWLRFLETKLEIIVHVCFS